MYDRRNSQNKRLGERYLTVKTISQKLDVAKSRVTKIIEGLMRRKLVERIEDPRDGRVKLITLTSEGHKKSKEIKCDSNTLYCISDKTPHESLPASRR